MVLHSVPHHPQVFFMNLKHLGLDHPQFKIVALTGLPLNHSKKNLPLERGVVHPFFMLWLDTYTLI